MSDLDDLRQALSDLPGSVRGALRAELQAAMADLAASIQDDKLSGQVLKVRSGRLRASITAEVSDDGESLSGTVGSDVPYAAIHEYGGTIVRRQAAAARRGRRPGGAGVTVEPERSYLRSALAEQADDIRDRLTQAILSAAQEAIAS